MSSLSEVQDQLRQFAAVRDWSRFHSPKNLAMALAGEVGELSALLQWVEPQDLHAWASDEANAQALKFEIADVLAYLLQFAESVGVDPLEALVEKIALNEMKYPVELSRGNATKYTGLVGPHGGSPTDSGADKS